MGCLRAVTQEIFLLILSSHSGICGRTPTQRHNLGSWLELVSGVFFRVVCCPPAWFLSHYYLRWDYDIYPWVKCFEAERKVLWLPENLVGLLPRLQFPSTWHFWFHYNVGQPGILQRFFSICEYQKHKVLNPKASRPSLLPACNIGQWWYPR